MLVTRSVKAEKNKVAITGLSVKTAERFTAFCRLKGRSRAEVAEIILCDVMDKDPEFRETEKLEGPEAKIRRG